jgi:hypothetical protein
VTNVPNDIPGRTEHPDPTDETLETQLSRPAQEELDSTNAVVADLTATLGVVDAAEGRPNPEGAPELWEIDQLRQWLATTLAHDGSSLESRLEGGSLDAQVQTYARAFADGLRGFELDRTKLRFPHDALTLARLKEGIEFGAITGLVIEAYPDAAQLEAIAQKVNPSSRADELDRMLRESVTDFLASHFQARGGKLLDGEDEESRVAYLRMRKWRRNGDGQPGGVSFLVTHRAAR